MTRTFGIFNRYLADGGVFCELLEAEEKTTEIKSFIKKKEKKNLFFFLLLNSLRGRNTVL